EVIAVILLQDRVEVVSTVVFGQFPSQFDQVQPKTFVPTHAIDDTAFGGGGPPRGGGAGHTLLGPLLQRGDQGVRRERRCRSAVPDHAGQRPDQSGRLDPPARFHLTHDTGVVHDTITAPWATPRNSRQPFTKPWARSSRSRSLSSSGMWS